MTDWAWSDGATGFITVGDARLEAMAWGPSPADAPTIVMLHEGLGSAALWRDFPKNLVQATGWSVFAYSRAGYGRSSAADLPRTIDYMTREALNVLPSVLDAIGFQRGVLLGHSDGATIAAEYAGGVEDMRVRGLILMAPHFFTEPMGLAEIAKARDAWEQTDLRDRMAKYHDDPEATFRGWNDAWLNPDFAAWDVAECIDYLRVPALAIQGRDDQYGTEAQVRVIEERSYAPVDLELLPDCRHSPHLEQPEKTLALTAEFVQRLARIDDEAIRAS